MRLSLSVMHLNLKKASVSKLILQIIDIRAECNFHNIITKYGRIGDILGHLEHFPVFFRCFFKSNYLI